MKQNIFLVCNKAECKKCGDIIQSKHRWDFVTCKCGSLSIDGGAEYKKRIGFVENGIDRSIYSNDSFENIREIFFRNGTTLLKDMSNEWLKNCIIYEKENRPDNKFIKIYEEELRYRESKNQH